MKKNQFIIIVDTVNHLNIISRLAGLFSRRRMVVDAMQTHLHYKEDTQRFIFSITETQENIRKLSRQIEKQVDVQSVHLYEKTISG